MIVSPATALATAVPIDRQGVAPPHVGPSVPVLETWSVMDRAVAGIASAIARTATAGRRDCLIKVLARNMFMAPLGSLSCWHSLSSTTASAQALNLCGPGRFWGGLPKDK